MLVAPAASASRSASRRSAAPTPAPRSSRSTAIRPSRASAPWNTSLQVPTTRAPSTATRCVASGSRPSRSASGLTPCSREKTRSRSRSAASTSSGLRASLISKESASVALDVLHELGFARVAPLVDEGECALGVVEGGGRKCLDSVEDRRDAELLVAVAGVAHRELAQEAASVGVVVLGVHPQEGDALAAPHGLALEVGELAAAGAAPGRPLVDHHRISAQLPQPRREGVGAASQQLIGLAVQRRQGGRRAAKGARTRLPGTLRLVRAACHKGERARREHTEPPHG